MTTTIYTKLLEAQKNIGAISKTKDNPFFHSKYADINAILAVVKPILNEQGLILLQAIVVLESRTALNTAIVEANTGEKIESNYFLPEITDPQKVGSAITYFRRYSLQSLLALEAEDDDAESAVGRKTNKKSSSTVTDDEPF